MDTGKNGMYSTELQLDTESNQPSRRVMSCMVNLPDGTYLIVNGAHAGVAGFGLASDPNLSAVIYDPEQPIGQRFSILNSTIVPRMYHSEATLLPDGRVLISGSDPQTPGFNEEFRIEVIRDGSPLEVTDPRLGLCPTLP